MVKGGKKDMACMKALYFSLSLFLSIGISLIDINYTCRPGSKCCAGMQITSLLFTIREESKLSSIILNTLLVVHISRLENICDSE